MRFSNILVATDFTECSARAVREAAALAERFGATLHVLHVVTEPIHEEWAGYSPAADFVSEVDKFEGAARRRLAAIAAACRGVLRVEVATRLGEPYEEILAYAHAHDVDLIVCGTHGRVGIERAIMGSVAQRLVRHAACPVLTVVPKQPAAAA